MDAPTADAMATAMRLAVNLLAAWEIWAQVKYVSALFSISIEAYALGLNEATNGLVLVMNWGSPSDLNPAVPGAQQSEVVVAGGIGLQTLGDNPVPSQSLPRPWAYHCVTRVK